MRPPLARTLIGIAALAIAYFFVAELGLVLATATKSVTLVWPASGLALVALRRGGLRLWPGVWLGAFLANALTPGVPVVVALAMASGNTLEAVAGSHLLSRFGFDDRLERASDVVRFTLLACVASTLVSAGIGSVSLWLGGVLPADRVLTAFRTWWIGDLTGELVFAPVLFTCVRKLEARPPLRRLAEAGAAMACVGAMSTAIFELSPMGSFSPFARPYMVFPLLLWPALRFGPRGASLAVALMSAIAVWATAHQHGPFARPTLGESLLALQVFTCVATLTPLLLAATVAERDRAKLAVEDFLAVASHELKTPLTPLLLNLERIERIVAPHSVPALAPVLASSERQIVRLARLVDDLLDMTRARVGALSVERTRMDLAKLVRETAEGFRDQLTAEKCDLDLAIDGPLEGAFDAQRIQQVVANLVTNAMKYGRGKPIMVCLRRIERGATSMAVLEVRDRGIGIPTDEHEHIFGRFGRAASTRHVSGLGLGLFIVREIVEAHAGRIAVESKEGAGSTFVVELPLQ